MFYEAALSAMLLNGCRALQVLPRSLLLGGGGDQCPLWGRPRLSRALWGQAEGKGTETVGKSQRLSSAGRNLRPPSAFQHVLKAQMHSKHLVY